MSFIQFVRGSKNFKELIKRRPTAFVLLALIADRARWKNDTHFDDLEVGEALVGDYKTYGVTEQIYRTDKNFLEKFKFITIKPTSRGTIVKLIDTSIFNLNTQPTNDRANRQLTNSQRTANEQLTTNKKDKRIKGKKDKRYTSPLKEEKVKKFLDTFNEIWGSKYSSIRSLESNFSYWLEEYTLEDMELAIRGGRVHRFYKDKLTPEMLLRRKNQQGENVDRIGELKNIGLPQRRELKSNEYWGPDGKIHKRGGGTQ